MWQSKKATLILWTPAHLLISIRQNLRAFMTGKPMETSGFPGWKWEEITCKWKVSTKKHERDQRGRIKKTTRKLNQMFPEAKDWENTWKLNVWSFLQCNVIFPLGKTPYVYMCFFAYKLLENFFISM